MAVAWTDITNAQVAAGAALTTALATALRDNPEGIAQRASGAPKIFGNAYDYQEFTTSGTWTKPSNAETGDRVLVQVVGGGGSGERETNADAQGGGGGGGAIKQFEDIDDLGATETVVIGAGGAARTGGDQNGEAGGDSSFGTSGTAQFLEGGGGAGGTSATSPGAQGGRVRHFATGGRIQAISTYEDDPGNDDIRPSDTGGYYNGIFSGGFGSPNRDYSGGSIYGAGGGAAGEKNGAGQDGSGGLSIFAGNGGEDEGANGTVQPSGIFPGGGGAGSEEGDSGGGGAGVVRVWCFREEA